MILFKEAGALHNYLQTKAQKGVAIGFVPTMGALHEGHRQLILQSCREADCTVVSIFVNPTQFNDPVDFDKYPSVIEEDIRLIATTDAEIVFLPVVKEMYPGGTTALEKYDLGLLETVLEGKYRPGHFQGVCQVMCRLLKIVTPAYVYMGQKDYQQCLVIRKLLEIMQLSVQLKVAPTVRESDGLAMSSRNRRISPELRNNAAVIYQALQYLNKNWLSEGHQAKCYAIDLLNRQNFRVDYMEVAEAETLQLLEQPTNKKEIALIAAFLGDVRLIDNLILQE